MCELLGLSSNTPADIRFSFSVLKERGGNTSDHSDGWGIGAYEGKGVRTFRDSKPCINSEIARFIEQFPIKSKIIISHIRKANRGKVCIENTHPFVRELYGYDWVFAHNGQLNGIKRQQLRFYRPVGTTDSEYAFCYLLDRIRDTFPERPKNPKKLWYFIEELAEEISQYGVFSFLLSDSRYLYAYSDNNLCWVTRKYPFKETQFLNTKKTIDLGQYMLKDDVITIVASSPLTKNEEWNVMQKGDFQVFKHGLPEASVKNRREKRRGEKQYALSA